MMPVTTRKRKLSSLDSDSPKRRSPRKSQPSPSKKKPSRRLNDDCPSPQKSPRRPPGSPTKSPRKSPFKPTIVTSSFYGKKKPIYLTPLERKAIKDSLPSPPPPLPPLTTLPSPPSQPKKQKQKQQQKKRKIVKGGPKLSGGTSHASEKIIKSFTMSTKTIRLQKPISLTSKPATTATAAPTNKPAVESKKAISITFSNLKPKPKIFVGAAFFSTGKKPTSMYKKSAAKTSTKSASVQGKNRAAPPQAKSEKTAQQQQPPAVTEKNQRQKLPEKAAVQLIQKEEKQPTTQPRTKFDPTDWMDSVNEEPGTPPTIRSPKMLKEKYGITQELMVLLTRTPPPCSTPSYTQEDSEPVLDLSDISPPSPSKGSAAVYPIFGSASKRSKKAALQAPASCSTPSGPVPCLQAPATKERSLRRRKEKQDDDQLIIDAGQKQFGATTCGSCGMIYSADNPEDHFQHTQFHQRFVDSIKFVGWKKERIVSEFWDGKILLVMPDDPKYAVKKAEDVRQIADSELGFQQVALSKPTQAKNYLFVNTERMVVGCVVAEPIRQAYRVLEESSPQKDMTRDDFMDRHRAWCCSTVPEQALCGISRVWVFSQARRRRIATRMLDTVRSSFIYGSHLTKEEIAFSDPTPDGKVFATNYCHTPTFLVYNFVA